MSHDHWHGGASGPSKAGLAEAVIVAPGWPRTRRTYLQTVHRLAFVSPPPRQAALAYDVAACWSTTETRTARPGAASGTADGGQFPPDPDHDRLRPRSLHLRRIPAETTLRKLKRGAPMYLQTRLFLAPLAITFIALVASWPAFAQTEAERKACEPDAQLHCPDEMPDRAKVQACLARKVNSLSPACKQLIENAGRRRHRVRGH
jgi:hypothetical protein